MEKYRIVQTKFGVTSIQFLGNGEIMHNPIGPWEEAHRLYMEPMQLVERLKDPSLEPLVIFDVGLGAATNVCAAMSLWNACGRGLKIVSFEKDLDLLKFTLENIEVFPFLKGKKAVFESLLTHGYWESKQGVLKWELRFGDFDSTISREREKADLIFYEPYSPKVNPEMWSIACFKKLYACTNKKAGTGLLATYSRATAVRTALLLAGYYVGPGVGVGFKEETTMAAANIEELPSVVGRRWLERLNKSHIPFPDEVLHEQHAELIKSINSHPQFGTLE